MKKSTLIVAFLLLGSAALMAQGGGGGFQQRSVPERVQSIHAKMDSAFKLTPEVLKQVDAVFTDYYTSQDKLRQESNGDFQGMREKMQPLTETRDEKLKKIIGDADFKTWKEVIEPSMRPRRNNN